MITADCEHMDGDFNSVKQILAGEDYVA